MPVKGHNGGEITPNRDLCYVPGAVPSIRLPSLRFAAVLLEETKRQVQRSVLSFFPQQKDFILYNLTLIFKSPELCFFCLLGLIAFTSLSSERCLPGKLIARLVLFSSRSLAPGKGGQRREREMPRLPLGSGCLQGQRPGGARGHFSSVIV